MSLARRRGGLLGRADFVSRSNGSRKRPGDGCAIRAVIGSSMNWKTREKMRACNSSADSICIKPSNRALPDESDFSKKPRAADLPRPLGYLLRDYSRARSGQVKARTRGSPLSSSPCRPACSWRSPARPQGKARGRAKRKPVDRLSSSPCRPACSWRSTASCRAASRRPARSGERRSCGGCP